MAKNKRSSDDDDNSDFEDVSPSKKQKTPKLSPPLYKAKVIETADSALVRVNASTADLDESILARMEKCLTRANHPETPEAEAKAALHLASKLMKTYNVTTAEILAHEAPEHQRNYAGSSTVAIQRRDGDRSKKVQQSNYIGTLCVAMEAFFGCKSYTSSGRSLKITFYGIAENTVAASSALEMVYNLIVEWARPYKGQSGKNSYCYGVANELLVTANREQKEEEERAKMAEEEAKAARLKQEQDEDQARLDRLHELRVRVEDEEEEPAAPVQELAKSSDPTLNSVLSDLRDMYPSSPEASDDEDEEHEHGEWNGFSDDEDNEPNESGLDNIAADFDDEEDDDDSNVPYDMPDLDIDQEIDALASTIKPSSARATPLPFRSAATQHDPRRDSVTAETAPGPEDPTWKSHMQAIKFRETTEKIATDWL